MIDLEQQHQFDFLLLDLQFDLDVVECAQLHGGGEAQHDRAVESTRCAEVEIFHGCLLTELGRGWIA